MLDDAILHLRLMIRLKLRPETPEFESMARTFRKTYKPYVRKLAKAGMRRRMTVFLDSV
tara:strand:- start:2576 stop:2752 length:177 start_codon:yes stop_codon:yes gene_type:complete